MSYKMSDNLAMTIRGLVKTGFTNEEVERGLEAFEKLLDIEDSKSSFDAEYGEELNSANIFDPDWDEGANCRLEGMLRKIERLQGNDTDGVMLKTFYTNIGFYDWLNDAEIKRCRAKDSKNYQNANNVHGGAGFHLDEAEADKYDSKCPHHFADYIRAYQLRNRIKAHDTPLEGGMPQRLAMIISLFVVYIDRCCENSELITECYEKQLINRKVNFVEYAKEKLEELNNGYDNKFLQLSWSGEGEDLSAIDYKASIKLYGEAGMGKTTQMRQLYKKLLEQVAAGEKKILPVWVQLDSLIKDENNTVEKMIRDAIGKNNEYYDMLFEKNGLALFMDGYNEVLHLDGSENIKKKLAGDVDTIHARYPGIFIAMTDRRKKSIPPCLSKNVAVYTFNGLTRDDMKEYVKLRAESDKVEEILEYLNSSASSWLDQHPIMPIQMNNLIEIMNDGQQPEDENDFYDRYLDFMFEREENDKKEMRMADLRFMLCLLSKEMNQCADEMTTFEIKNLWLNKGHARDINEAGRMFDLAIDMPVLVPGSVNNTYKFAYPQYFYKLNEEC